MAPRLIKKLFGAAADQALLSILNLAISFAFIRLGSKAEYGLYVLLLGPIYLLQGFQNALFVSPYATRVAGGLCPDKAHARAVFFWGQFIFVVLAAAIGWGGLLLYSEISDLAFDDYLPIFFAFGILGALIREGVRSYQYAEGDVRSALLGNLSYSVAICLFLAYSVFGRTLSLSWLFFSMGLGGCFAILTRCSRFPPVDGVRGEFREFWTLGRWAIVGVVFTWVNSNFYPYFIAHNFSVDSVAEVNAARLFLMPFVLVLPAWSNLFRPMFAKFHASGDSRSITKYVRWSAAGGGAVLAVYGLLIFALYPKFYFVFGESYKGIEWLIATWCIYYVFFLIRTVYQGVLMVDQRGYRHLSAISTYVFFCLWPALWLGAQAGVTGVVLGLAFLELLQWFLIRRLAVQYLRPKL